MRLDHIAYRVQDRNVTAKKFSELFGYSVGTEFDIQIQGKKRKAVVLKHMAYDQDNIRLIS